MNFHVVNIPEKSFSRMNKWSRCLDLGNLFTTSKSVFSYITQQVAKDMFLVEMFSNIITSEGPYTFP